MEIQTYICYSFITCMCFLIPLPFCCYRRVVNTDIHFINIPSRIPPNTVEMIADPEYPTIVNNPDGEIKLGYKE